MKRLASLVLALLMSASLICGVSAHTSGNNWGEIPLYNGKITLDGEKDEIYDKGFTVSINNRTDGKTGGATGKAYMLWGSGKMYIFVEVTDADIVKYNASKAAHQNEGVEFTLDFSNEGKNRSKLTAILGNNSANPMGDSPKDMYYVQCKTNAKGYTVEIVCDLNKQTIQAAKSGAKYGINLLINDITGTSTRGIIRTKHKNNPTENETAKYDYITLSSKEVKIAAATTKAPSTPAAPATFDAVTLIAVAAAASLSGAAVLKKRR